MMLAGASPFGHATATERYDIVVHYAPLTLLPGLSPPGHGERLVVQHLHSVQFGGQRVERACVIAVMMPCSRYDLHQTCRG